MKVNIKEWKKIYDAVQRMGKMLKDSKSTYNLETKITYPPVHPLSEKMKRDLDDGIKRLLVKSSNYLNANGLMPNEPLALQQG